MAMAMTTNATPPASSSGNGEAVATAEALHTRYMVATAAVSAVLLGPST